MFASPSCPPAIPLSGLHIVFCPNAWPLGLVLGTIGLSPGGLIAWVWVEVNGIMLVCGIVDAWAVKGAFMLEFVMFVLVLRIWLSVTWLEPGSTFW